MQPSIWICLAALAACASEPADTIEPRATTHDAVDDHVVTLITGDRVELRGDTPLVTPGPGRLGTRYTVSRAGGHVHVVPSDAEHLIATDQLDAALFDVTLLLASGYGDKRRSDLPLVVTGTQPSLAASLDVDRTFPALHMAALRHRKDAPALHSFAAAAGKIWLDRVRRPVLDRSVPQIGGDVAHARGLTGAGVTVAVLDSGVDLAHPDLAAQIVAAEDFTDDGRGPGDVVGHGTHVASIIAGTGAASDGRLAGVAPGARLISGRVCSEFECPDSAILAGMEWAAVEQHARIINLSLGALDTPELDPLEQAVDALSADTGALFVIAAGNDGLPGTIESPGSADAALTVGAVDRDDSLAEFSSQGPRLGDSAIKPEVTAPGVGIVAALAADLPPIGEPVDDFYQAVSGTSMATPHVAGAAALLLQQHPDWTGAQLKAQLIATAKPDPARDGFAQGAGRIDADRATRQAVSAEPAVLNLGVAAFPHDDDPAIVRTLRYHNDGAAPVTLALAATLGGPPIAVSPATLTVGAGETSAPVTVTVRTDGALADRAYSGAVVATAGDVRVETPVSVDREVESYDVTFEVIADGAPGQGFLSLFSPRDQRTTFVPVDQRRTQRLPRGTYALNMSIDDSKLSTVWFPRFVADHEQTVTFDGAIARKTAFEVGDPGVAPATTLYAYDDRTTGVFDSSAGFGFAVSVGQLGGPLPPAEFVGLISDTQSDTVFGPAKTVYHLAHFERGRVPIGFAATIPRSQLAVVDGHHAGRGDFLRKGAVAMFDDPQLGLIGDTLFVQQAYPATFDRTDLFFGNGFVWDQVFVDSQLGDSPFPVELTRLRGEARYRPGQHVQERWNGAPAGPAFARNELFAGVAPHVGSTATRTGDDLVLQPAMTADASVPAHFLFDRFIQQRITLERDGAVIADLPDTAAGGTIRVPPGAATYRYAQDTVRDPARYPLSSHVSAAWTFRSAHVPGDRPRPLPLLSMRFLPALDDQGATTARVLVLPIRFERAPDAGTALVFAAELEVSLDSGAHYQRVPVIALGERGVAVIVHPRGARTVSLRGRATDLDGNRNEVTIVDAYAVTER